MIESFSRVESRVSVGNLTQELKSVCENLLIDLSLISGFTAVPGLMYPLVLPKVQPLWNCSKQMGGS